MCALFLLTRFILFMIVYLTTQSYFQELQKTGWYNFTSLDNFTAEVCKVINGQQQDQTIGMFRLSSLDENLELDDERGTTV